MSAHHKTASSILLIGLSMFLASELSLAGGRVRKSYLSLTATEVTRFQDACVALKAVDPGAIDPNLTGWDDFVQLHDDYFMSAHRGSAFLAWHRMFLLEFEDALRSVDNGRFSEVTVPYWDWTVDPFPVSVVGGDGDSGTEIVTTGPFAFSTGNWSITINPKNGPELKRAFTAPLPNAVFTSGEVSAALLLEVFDTAPWNASSTGLTSFRNVLEGWVGQAGPGLHNRIHVLIDGNMLDPGSAVNDPVFWMHHANVDRIWCIWQNLYPWTLHHMPMSGAMMGHNTFDLMEPFGVSPCDATNMVALDYEYDDTSGPCVYDAGHIFEGLTASQVMMKVFI